MKERQLAYPKSISLLSILSSGFRLHFILCVANSTPYSKQKLQNMAAASTALLSTPIFRSGERIKSIADISSSRSIINFNSRKEKRRLRSNVKAELNPQVVISLSTGLSLFMGRFVFFDFQRENVAKQGLPEQNGVSHFEAGDTRAKEYLSLLKSNDPVGFNIVDVLSWGSIGHIIAYSILATSSNGYDPHFFG